MHVPDEPTGPEVILTGHWIHVLDIFDKVVPFTHVIVGVVGLFEIGDGVEEDDVLFVARESIIMVNNNNSCIAKQDLCEEL